MPQLVYATEEILSEHEYVRFNEAMGHRLHGGYDADGEYHSPRTLKRWPAIDAWRENFLAAGGELIDASTRILKSEHYPNHAQMKLLLDHGIGRPLWNSMSTTGIIEGRGKALANIVAPDFQKIVEEDITETTTAHLNKGLFVAHGLDEGGAVGSEIGAHDTMWFVARDLVLGENAYPVPEIPQRGGRPGADQRELSEVPEPYEALIKQLMGLLMIEIRAEKGFLFNAGIMRDPTLFTDRREQAEIAAKLVDLIRVDEKPHVAYLQLFLSELRAFTFKTSDGRRVKGAEFIDPLWERIVKWSTESVPPTQMKNQRAFIEQCIRERAAGEDGAAGEYADELLSRFDALWEGESVAA